MRKLKWNRCQHDLWCRLDTVNLQHVHFDDMEGVYIIWHGGEKPRVVYVGQGVIYKRLYEHREDERIQQYADHTLYVTWARVDKSSLDGVERYLADYWKPKVGEKHPDAPPIEVNSPFE